jgi:hypothetical protein
VAEAWGQFKKAEERRTPAIGSRYQRNVKDNRFSEPSALHSRLQTVQTYKLVLLVFNKSSYQSKSCNFEHLTILTRFSLPR